MRFKSSVIWTVNDEEKVTTMRQISVLLLSLLLFASLAWAEDEAPPTISYYEVKPSLVVNLASGGKYARCDIQLMTKDDDFLEQLTLHGPAIRHTLLMLLSEQDGKKIKTPDGKEALRKQAMDAVNTLMKELAGKESLKALYFTTFFVQ